MIYGTYLTAAPLCEVQSAEDLTIPELSETVRLGGLSVEYAASVAIQQAMALNNGFHDSSENANDWYSAALKLSSLITPRAERP